LLTAGRIVDLNPASLRHGQASGIGLRNVIRTGIGKGFAMGTRLYVGNLPYDTDEDAIKAFFETGGRQVRQVKIVTDRDTGRPRGFAFVEMADDGQAQSAINELNGQSLGGRTIVVNEAREPQRGGRGGGGGGGGYGGGGGRGGGGYGGGGGGGGGGDYGGGGGRGRRGGGGGGGGRDDDY
jgi:RNA recognition motif-containing protein